jgi:flagellar hook-associated protein 2
MTVSSVLSSDQITTLIQQAEAAYQAPANALQAQEKPIEAQISALGKVQSSLSSLQSALSGLNDVQSLAQTSASSSAPGVVTVSATNAAQVGTYNLTGIHQAQAETLVSSGFAGTSAMLGSGSIAIRVGSASAVTVAIASGQSSLAGIATAINQAHLGVEATVIFDGVSYRLALTGDATGTANAFTVSGAGNLSNFSSASGTGHFTQTQAASNASFSLNGIAITSGSNTVSGVVPGVTFTLAASGSATVQVTQSVTALDKVANSLVSALNGVLGTINQYSSYTPASSGASGSQASGAGPLLGNIGLQILRNGLLDAITAPPTAGIGAYNSLSAIGFSITSGGTLAFNDATFQKAAQSNYAGVAALLGQAATATSSDVTVQGVGAARPGTYAIDVTSNSGGAVSGSVNGEAASGAGGLLTVTGSGAAQGLELQITTGVTGALGQVTVSNGLFGTLSSLVNSALSSGGGVPTQLKSLNATITSLNQQIAQLQQQAQQETAALTQQYSNAEATLSQLETVGNFLSSYFNQSTSGTGG